MTSRSLSGRQFDQDASGAERAAADGPVSITIEAGLRTCR